MRSQEKKTHDVVYIIKEGAPPDELRYSLRSVEKNFPAGKVWIYGFCPEGIVPDEFVPVEQKGQNKWEKVTDTIRQICANEDITEDFWLFNDDFFIMKKCDELPPLIIGTLWHRAQRIEEGRKTETRYAYQLRDTARALRDAGLDRLDYAAHAPILINRAKALKTIEMFPGKPMFRSLYGNYAKIGGVISKDTKIADLTQKPDGNELILSTNDKSFAEGEAGKYIRNKFKKKSRFERSRDEISDSE